MTLYRLHSTRDLAGRFTRWLLTAEGDIILRWQGVCRYHRERAPVVLLGRSAREA